MSQDNGIWLWKARSKNGFKSEMLADRRAIDSFVKRVFERKSFVVAYAAVYIPEAVRMPKEDNA